MKITFYMACGNETIIHIYIYFFFLKKSFALVTLSPIPSEEFGNYIFKT